MKDKLSKAEDKYLPELLGKILLPKPYKHQAAQTFEEMGDSSFHCSNCDEVKYKKDSVCPCPSIVIDDWNVAMKWQDWACEECGRSAWHKALFEVYKSTWEYKADICYETWLECKLESKHYLKAAALCKLGSEAK